LIVPMTEMMLDKTPSDGVATAIPATTQAAETAPTIYLVLSFIDSSLSLRNNEIHPPYALAST